MNFYILDFRNVYWHGKKHSALRGSCFIVIGINDILGLQFARVDEPLSHFQRLLIPKLKVIPQPFNRGLPYCAGFFKIIFLNFCQVRQKYSLLSWPPEFRWPPNSSQIMAKFTKAKAVKTSCQPAFSIGHTAVDCSCNFKRPGIHFLLTPLVAFGAIPPQGDEEQASPPCWEGLYFIAWNLLLCCSCPRLQGGFATVPSSAFSVPKWNMSTRNL